MKAGKSPTSMPSMPAAPSFALTCFQARARFSGRRTSFSVYPRELAVSARVRFPTLMAPLGGSGFGRVHRSAPRCWFGPSQVELAGQTTEGGGSRLVARDKTTGELVGEIPLPMQARGTPMTYEVDGRQYIALTLTGSVPELVALALPEQE